MFYNIHIIRFECKSILEGIIMKILRSTAIINAFLLPFLFTALNPDDALSQRGNYYTGARPYWQQEVDCEIRVTLDTENHTLCGSEKIVYTNNSPDTLTRFFIHLYPNAFREKVTQLVRDHMPRTKYFIVGLPESNRGWIDITKLSSGGEDIKFDTRGTILSADFPSPLPPGGKETLEIEFKEKIRKRIGRSGYTGNHYDIAQWYPKMAVYDKNGWHPDQFRKGEFYGEFGDFDVHITLPDEYVVAATGLPVSGDPGWNRSRPEENLKDGSSAGQKTVHFRAQNVHDFAWCADPDFVVQDTTWHNIQIMSFYRKSSPAWKDSVLARGLRTMKWLEEFAGPYGYPQISIVDCPTGGGMEYPMLVMNGSPDEDLILHEVGHNYFYGMLANDERAEAWMDEGFTQYQMLRYSYDNYGPYGRAGKDSGLFSPPGIKLWERISKPVITAHRTGYAERLATPYHEFKNNARTMVYLKGPLFLRYIRYIVGDEKFDEIMHTYFERWKFKHVDEEAFLSVCEEVSGRDLEELFRQWLHTTKECDYKLERFDVEKSGEDYEATVDIERRGEMMTPFSLVFRFADGNTITKRVDGMLRTIEKSYTFNKPPVSAAVNPANEILDIYLLDNFQPRRRDLAFDNPASTRYPHDAYQVRWLPVGFYNDIDGAKFGLRLKGGYDNRYRKFTLQSLYSAESERYDFYADFEHPLGYFGRDASLKLTGYYREGRQGASLKLNKILRKTYYDPGARHLSFKFAYNELTDTAYVYPGTYEKGVNIKSGLSLSFYPATDLFDTGFKFSFGRSFWGSDYNYEKSSLELRVTPSKRFPVPFKPRMRFYAGHSSVNPPLQEKYRLSGAGPLERDNYFWLRSKGAFWKDSYNNFQVPGSANLRGYFDCGLSFKRLYASNFELQMPFPLPGKMKFKRDLYLFYDWGGVYDKDPFSGLSVQEINQLGVSSGIFKDGISDFGIGVSLFGVTAEFPIYLSNPAIVGGEDKWDFRWTVGINKLF